MATKSPTSTSRKSSLKLFLVDDGGLEDLAVWAVNASAAKAIARRAYGKVESNFFTGDKRLPYEAYVFAFPMDGVTPPKVADFETRESVLKQIGADPRYIKYRETR